MSHFPSTHLLVSYTSGVTTALTGQRLATVCFKSTKNKEGKLVPPKLGNVAVSVPPVTEQFFAPSFARLVPHICEYLEGKQNEIIKSIYENSNGSVTSIQDADISIDAILGYLEAESTGGRLTKEGISDWFKLTLNEPMIVAVGVKLGFISLLDEDSGIEALTTEQLAVISKHVKGISDLFSSLAGGKTEIAEKTLVKMREIITDNTEVSGDIMATRLLARIENMLKPKDKIASIIDSL